MTAAGCDPLWVVVVHWNQPRACERTLRRLRRQGCPVHLLVVDNGSTGHAVDRLRPLADEVIETGANLGYGPGANVGLRHWLATSESPWCVVVPHDALPDEGVLRQLVEAGDEHPRAGLVCADVGDQASPTVDPYLGPLPGPAKVRNGYEPVAYPHGTCVAFRRDFARDVGLFDERYFAYNEEAELGLRAATRGWEVGLVRGAMVENPGQGNVSGIVDYLMLRNTILLLREHFGLWPAVFRTIVAVGQLGLGMVRRRRRAPWFSARARVLALRHAWSGQFGPPPAELR